MKSRQQHQAQAAPAQRQAAAHAGGHAAAGTPRQLAQGAQIAQLAGGKKPDEGKKKPATKGGGKKAQG